LTNNKNAQVGQKAKLKKNLQAKQITSAKIHLLRISVFIRKLKILCGLQKSKREACLSVQQKAHQRN